MLDLGGGLIRYPIQQYGYVVNDLEQAAGYWTKFFNAGPFLISKHHKSKDVRYRGAPCDADLSYAFGQAGPAHIQLIHQHCDTPSVYRDIFAPGQQGFHHVALLTPQWEEERARFEAEGCPSVMELVSGARVAYMDARGAIGCFVELYEDRGLVQGIFDDWKALHEGWDGQTDPLRPL
ncbi:VOC family protein [Erythrobacter ani]|uniref:VOC family protein n=1 Tax=Erythrobacter ani TaxID=2827235 RepID=A0ABS6ST30_9SPHN|nr:VOC family protein [Erythrobacter ani]MBV7267533.1 VOC family protein [Erythrobacter ani]